MEVIFGTQRVSYMYKVIDLFAGVGGLSYGFEKDPEFKIVAANEILKPMATAYSLNHPNVKMYNEDISTFGKEKLVNDLGQEYADIDIIVGGPPCQAYSTVGKRLIDDPRGKLFQEYYRLLVEFKPKLFVFENVTGLLTMANGELIETIVKLFSSLGYKVKYKTLNAADFGAPQQRKRVIIVGTTSSKEFEFPEETHTGDFSQNSLFGKGLTPHVTLADALSDLPLLIKENVGYNYITEPQNKYQELMRKQAPELILEHEKPNYNANLVAIMNALPEGGTPKDLPLSLRPKSGFGNSYSRLWWDRPSTTITRNLGTPSSARCVHPLVSRALTTREGARLQGFPDNYQFFGSRSQKNLQIGNAVPTFLSIALKNAILKHLD